MMEGTPLTVNTHAFHIPGLLEPYKRTKVFHSFNSRIQPRLDAVDTSMEIETEEEKDLTLTAGNLLL